MALPNEMTLQSHYIHRRSFTGSSVLFENSLKYFLFFDFILLLGSYNFGVCLSPYFSIVASLREVVFISILHAIVTVVTNTGLGHYEMNLRYKTTNIVINSLIAHLIALTVSVTVAYFGFYSTFGRLTILYGAVSSYGFAVVCRLLLRQYVLMKPYRFTLVGEGPLFARIKNRCEGRNSIFRLVPLEVDLGRVEGSIAILRRQGVRGIVCSSRTTKHPSFVDFSLAAAASGLTVSNEVEFYTYLFEHIPIDSIDKGWLLHMGLARQSSYYQPLKRLFDSVFSLSCIILLSPLLALLALLVKLGSPGPILFVQERVGRFSRPFRIYKFRTMYHRSREDGEPHVTSANDVRVTLVGKIIRPLHLDELPQLFNILKGEMSLVGVRPETIPYARKMQDILPLYHLRDVYRPGLTGHAQLSMPYPMHVLEDTKEKLGFDFYYLTNQSILLDVKIIAKTVFMTAFPLIYRRFSRR